MRSSHSRPHVVILGAGFGGMYVARALKKAEKRGEIDLTVINRTNYFLFTPMLHEVATGGLRPFSVAEPLREIFRGSGVRIIQGSVESIDTNKRHVVIDRDAHARTISYDYLVVATGATTNHYGISGAAEHTYPLKDLQDAAAIRSRIIDVFEQAIMTEDPKLRRELLSFAVVGGGATGVEMAAEMAEFIHDIVNRYYSHSELCQSKGHTPCHPDEPRVSLLHLGPELLTQFAPKLRQAAAQRLRKNGVSIIPNATVTSVDGAGLIYMAGPIDPDKPKVLPAATVIWAAGVTPIIPRFEDKEPSKVGGRLAVDTYFRMVGEQRVFALGDVAAYVDMPSRSPQSSNKPLPMLAQVAVREADVVAHNVLASIRDGNFKSFSYHSKGSMVSVGQWFAVGEIFSIHIVGMFAWWLWRTVYLFKFVSWSKRLRIAIDWTLNMFYPRDITKLT